MTGELKVWDTRTGEVISELSKLPGMDVYARIAPSPRFSADGNSVTVTLYTGKTCTWNVEQGSLIGCVANTPPGQGKSANLAAQMAVWQRTLAIPRLRSLTGTRLWISILAKSSIRWNKAGA